MSVDHYENFPVASLLCPAALRPAVRAIYAFARTADDIADEGDAPPTSRLADLAAYRVDLQRVAAGKPPSARWPEVFVPLGAAVAEWQLPVELLDRLLRAFEQDLVKLRYRDRAELLDYCSRSAEPVGRLMLHLYGIDDPGALRRSDAICSALQLINFWQDLGTDVGRDRVYLPQSDLARHGIDGSELLAGVDDRRIRAAVADVAEWARTLMNIGAALPLDVGGRAGWELRLVVQGGLRILDKIASCDHATMSLRPTLAWQDAPLLVWRAARMRRRSGAALAGDAA